MIHQIKNQIFKAFKKILAEGALKDRSAERMGQLGPYLWRKYKTQILIIAGLAGITIATELLPLFFKEKPKPLSLDSMVPKEFVLMPIEIINGKDISNIIGRFGVVDLYSYEKGSELPQKQAAEALKILPSETEEGGFTALVPEKQVSFLLKYANPFYAVIQNPNKKGARIFPKKTKNALIVIEEDF